MDIDLWQKVHKQSKVSVSLEVRIWLLIIIRTKTTTKLFKHRCLFKCLRKNKNKWKNQRRRRSWAWTLDNALSCKGALLINTNCYMKMAEMEVAYQGTAEFVKLPKRQLHSAVFWNVKQRRLIWHRRFGTAYRSHLQGPSRPTRSFNTWIWDR